MRQFTPGPWHEALAHHYRDIAKIAPHKAAEYLAHKYDIAPPWRVPVIVAWVLEGDFTKPCPEYPEMPAVMKRACSTAAAP